MADAAATPTIAEQFGAVLIGGVSKLIDHELGAMPQASSGMTYTQVPQGGAPGTTVDAGRSIEKSTLITGVADKTVYMLGGVMLLLAVGGWVFARRH